MVPTVLVPRRAALVAVAVSGLLAHPAQGQDNLTIFRSTQAANLPTAETLQRGRVLFEISHRFEPAVADGVNTLWGLDGPVFLRLGLGVAVTDRLIATLTRSNLQDNYDFNAKLRLFEPRDGLPLMVAVAGGVAYNGELPESFERSTQYYGQLILNSRLGERLAVGVVPWILRDPDLEASEPQTTAGMGAYAQFYLSRRVSLLGEWNATQGFSDFTHDAGTLALELATRGHFFKLMVTNSIRLNPSQFLAGADVAFEPGEWRFGFNVTRVIVF